MMLLSSLLLSVVVVFGGGGGGRGVEGYSGKALLISMDGFRWDYLNKISGLPNFDRLRSLSSSVDYVNNTFATKTFPCHYSIATGLYEEVHGIVANHMYDPVRNATFGMASKEPFWWNGGEPIWVTAENQEKKTGVYFWPGSEAEIRGVRPDIYKAYNQSVPFEERVETALGWFVEESRDFVALYFHEPDATGHKFGPDSEEIANKVRQMDCILGLILKTLADKNLTDSVNVILTADHGMAEIDPQHKLLNLWDYVNHTQVKLVPDSGIVTPILPEEGQEDAVFAAVSKIPHVTAWKKADIPEHFHYQKSVRIMPIVILADEGWMLADNFTKSQSSEGKGNHGYSNELMSMKPMLFAWGPNFKKNYRTQSIGNLDIYPLLCKLLNIDASPNNGSSVITDDFLVAGSPVVIQQLTSAQKVAAAGEPGVGETCMSEPVAPTSDPSSAASRVAPILPWMSAAAAFLLLAFVGLI